MSRRSRKGQVAYRLRIRAMREAARRRQHNLCYWCFREMVDCIPENETNPRMVTADHLTPTVYGGQTRHENIVAACRECNNFRHPELNKVKGGTPILTIGDDSPKSPFETLGEILSRCGENGPCYIIDPDPEFHEHLLRNTPPMKLK